jgi:hypothetical protein
MKTLLMASILFFTWCPAYADEPTDFRGMKWGITVEEANRIIQANWDKRRESGEILSFTHKTDYPVNDRHWRLDYSDTIGTEKVNIVLNFLDKKFVSVLMSFDSKSFDVIEPAFKSRYGKPSFEQAVPMTNAFGATFMNQRRRWDFQEVRIMLMKHANVKSGGASIATRPWIEYQAAERKEKKAKAADDL